MDIAAAVEARTVIEQARGAVAESFGLGIEEALTPVRRCSAATGLPLLVIARAVVQHAGDVEWLRRYTADPKYHPHNPGDGGGHDDEAVRGGP